MESHTFRELSCSQQQLYLAPPGTTLRGKEAVLRHFERRGILERHRGRYWKSPLNSEATMVMTSDDRAL